ncbi:MAG: MFS transporter [Parcubacteria group bacterium]
MILFWATFDGIMSFIAPIAITQAGFSNTAMGIIIGSSSISGALFDFFICRIVKNFFFRRLFLIMFAICFVFPLILSQAKTIWIFLIAMAIWGVYYDLFNFGVFDFVGRFTKEDEHASSFGVVSVFRSLAEIIAPLVAGLVIIEFVDWKAYSIGWIFLLIAFLLFMSLLFYNKNKFKVSKKNEVCRNKKILIELRLWRKVGRTIFPVLILTMFLYIVDAFFWTIGPIFSEGLGLEQFGGILLVAYSIPTLMVGWFVGSLTRKMGKKKTAYLGLLIGSLALVGFSFGSGPIIPIVITFIAAFFLDFAFPAINGAYADYINETPVVEGEIESLEDFFNNIGYIVGPIIAGLLADLVGFSEAFSVLGLAGALLSIILLVFSTKSITVKVRKKELAW